MAPGIKRRYIPNQHGAWAMLVIPFLFGMFSGRAVPLHALLLTVWLTSYLFTFPLLQWLKTRKLHLYQGPMLLYGCLFAVSGIALAVCAPQLLRWIPFFIPLFLINCWFARINRERSFANDLAAVLLFSLMVFVSHELGGEEHWRVAAPLFLLSVMYFTGTVFYVKTIIREKHNRMFYWYSVAYHLAILIAGIVWYPPLLTGPLAVLLIRAAWAPRARITVKQSGILEIVYALFITVAVFLAYGI